MEVRLHHSVGTFRFYQSHINHFLRYCDSNQLVTSSDVTPDIIVSYIQAMKKTVTNATINKRIGILKRCFKHNKIDFDYLYQIPKLKEQKKTFKMLSREELKRINRYVSLWPEENYNNLMYKVLIMLLTETGARINELLNVKKKNIKVEKQYGSILLTTTKTNDDRIVFFTKHSFVAVKKLIDESNSPFLFFNKLKNRQMNYDDVRFIMRKLKHRLNIEQLHPHMFRHSMATIWLENGADIKSVMTILGHRNIETTNRYLHNNVNHVKDTYVQKFKI